MISTRNGLDWLLVFNHYDALGISMSEAMNIKGNDVGEVALEFVRRYVIVLRDGQSASADDCLRLLVARAKAKKVLAAAEYDRAVALAQSVAA
jgi:hypothetical protein